MIIYKARLLNNSGKFIINGKVRFGMIKLGVENVSIFPNNGITIENRGIIIFNGKTYIGNNSAISLGEKGILEFGENFTATTGLRIACYDSVRFGDNVLVGWNVQISDTDFHAIKDVKTGIKTKGHGSVSIGKDVWIANGCRIYKNVTIPEKCVVGAETVLFKGVDTQPCSLITNNREITVSSRRIYHDRDDDQITY